MRTLLLDNTFFPVKIINWQRAMLLLVSGRAEVIDEYEDKCIRSVTQSFKLPKILRLFSRHKSAKPVKFCRQNVYLRDNYTCQYCATKFKFEQLTFDHVIPLSKGGPTNWENVVTSCRSCNTKKGDLNLKQAKMTLIKKPKKPGWSAELCLKLKTTDPNDWLSWLPTKMKKI